MQGMRKQKNTFSSSPIDKKYHNQREETLWETKEVSKWQQRERKLKKLVVKRKRKDNYWFNGVNLG